MRIKQLELFIQIANCTSITHASQKCFTSQQNASKALRKLEEELDVKLFYRFKNGMFLTEEGLKVYELAKDIVLKCDFLKNYFLEPNKPIKSPVRNAVIHLLIPYSVSPLAVFMLNQLCSDNVSFPDTFDPMNHCFYQMLLQCRPSRHNRIKHSVLLQWLTGFAPLSVLRSGLP